MVVAWPAPSLYLNQCWHIVNWTLGTKFGEILIAICLFSFKKMHLTNSGILNSPFWRMAAILSWPQCVKDAFRHSCSNHQISYSGENQSWCPIGRIVVGVMWINRMAKLELREGGWQFQIKHKRLYQLLNYEWHYIFLFTYSFINTCIYRGIHLGQSIFSQRRHYRQNPWL